MDRQPPSLVATIGIYAAYYIGLSAIIFAILRGLEYVAGIVIDNAAVSWVPAIVAAMQVGQR